MGWRAFAAFLMTALILAAAAAGGDAAKPPTVKEIMGKLHRGPNCLRANIARDLRADDPDWEEIEKETREFVRLAEDLPKDTPPRGGKESWDTQTKLFVSNARALHAAAEKHDRQAALKAHAKLGNCKSCHDVHKPK
jgi:hypothetical protein